ncbi:MAG TPA: AzlD domain-containing protein [Egibacteraceae bacterium]|nr:AzlD domain-containing protein [Egibacteraceae bacterium]
MSALLVLTAAALVTWALRVAFITVVPAGRMPARVQRALDDVAPSVMAAIVAVQLAGGHAGIGILPVEAGAALIGGAVAWRTSNLGLSVLAGVVAYGLLGLL